MPQLFCAPTSVPEPYKVQGGHTTTTAVQVTDTLALVWSDSTTGTIAIGKAISVYGGTAVDSTINDYLLVLVKGNPLPYLVKQQDRPNIDTLVGSSPSWAATHLLINGRLMPIPQY